ncbi:MAG TPA: ATP-binding protein [Vicinamibacterales bacterium]|nr:ATP-binding protein [Vicinamibacterales bacterium]
MRPLRIYLLILVLGAMLPGILLTGALVWRAFANNRAASERRLVESARVDAAALDREFAGAISILEALATSPTLDRNDLEAFHAEGRRVQETQPGWYTILLLSRDGRQLVSTRRPWGATLLPVVEPDSLRRLFETGRPTVGNVRRPPGGGPEHRFAIRVPVFRDGELKFALSAVLNVESLARVVPKQLASSEEWTRSILDPDGTIAVRTRGAENYIGSPASDAFREQIRHAPETIGRLITREGISVYAATSCSAYGWTTVIVVPSAALDGPLVASTTATLAGGVLLMMCGLAAVLFVSRRLTADLTAATRAAEAVAEGQSVVQADGHVSETRRLQRSLASAASLLENRARERDEQIRRTEAARAEAERANQTKDQFLAVLGHELRNPLAPALTALELMRARDPEVFKREREVLERQIVHMTRLVNDLMDVSRLARGTVELDRRRFELREAADRAVDMVQPLVVQKRLTLHVSVPARGLVIDGDIDRIVQVLTNLLTNAAKYTPSGGRIALTASASNTHVRIECEDNGPGVPAELVAKLFDRFAQGPQTLDRREGGLGLGLALARSFTELHGGTIAFESVESGTGSRFVVTLPAVAERDEAPSTRPAEPVAVGISRRVLLVEDNKDARDMLRDALEGAGHVVRTAATGSEAIALTTEFRPDVGILDIGLPGMNGYELARRLRQSNTAIRLIALTGYGQVTDADAARSAGFDAHCVKPVSTAALRRLIDGGWEHEARA